MLAGGEAYGVAAGVDQQIEQGDDQRETQHGHQGAAAAGPRGERGDEGEDGAQPQSAEEEGQHEVAAFQYIVLRREETQQGPGEATHQPDDEGVVEEFAEEQGLWPGQGVVVVMSFATFA